MKYLDISVLLNFLPRGNDLFNNLEHLVSYFIKTKFNKFQLIKNKLFELFFT